MRRSARQSLILEQVSREGEVLVAQLCRLFDTSEMTIRRDLAELDRAGLLRRVHGGAVAVHSRIYEPPLALRRTQALDAKAAIAARAIELVEDGDSIALDVGSTVLALAPLLSARRGLTIVTTSLPVVRSLLESTTLDRGTRLILTGGQTRLDEHSLIGDLAIRAYRELHVDTAFLGIGGVSPQDGLTEYNLDDAAVKRELIRSADRVHVLAHGEKIGRTTFASVGPLDAVASVITDASAPADVVAAMRGAGHEIHVADEPVVDPSRAPGVQQSRSRM